MAPVSSVRAATETDLPAARALLSLPATWTPARFADAQATARYLLVCDAPGGGLAAAAIVSFTAGRAQLEALQLAPDHESTALETRMLGVAEALAEAFGCHALGVELSHAA
jgi:GNAT superfamily N-acetyltransferase